MIAVWIGLAVCVLGIVGGLAAAVVRGLRAWRDLKGLGREAGERLEAISASTEEIDTHLQRASDGSEQLSAALERLRRSRAQLDVLLSAVGEARELLGRTVPFLSRG